MSSRLELRLGLVDVVGGQSVNQTKTSQEISITRFHDSICHYDTIPVGKVSTGDSLYVYLLQEFSVRNP